ncbi:ABC transporter ATP-binding protein [Clostridium oceanicum]|uniref:ABC transporter ATP-binding protein n=1 Tax=Clostridium oceanicum TaxID=1543 RepID=A0ABN1JNT3_9CLOT
MGTILKTNNLTKIYKGVTVVDKLNITLNKGEIYGFIGKNGAGKTTTIKMIMGLIKANRGEIELFGSNKNNQRIYGKIGSIIEYPGFYPNLTAKENLEIHRRMIGMQSKSCIKDSLNIVGLKDAADKRVRNFSLGMKQRLGVARAILHNPELLILDEPTNGLDPVGIKEMREFIEDLSNKRGVTVLISSHILSEVQLLATKIGIINKGVLLEEIGYDELQRRNRHYLELKVNNDKKASFLLENKLNISDYEVWEKNIIRVYEKINKSSKINRTMITNDIDVDEISVKLDNLEDYFIRLTGKND